MERISFTGQVRVYLGKCFRIFQNEKGWKNFIAAGLIAAIVCCVTGEDMFVTFAATQKGSFALVCACIWTGIFNSIRSVCAERAIVKREHRTGMKISAYVTAHVLYEAAVCLAECAIITAIVCLRNIANLPAFGILLPAFLELFVDFYLILLAADLLGLVVSCVVRTENAAMSAMPFVLILQMVLAGGIFELEGLMSFLSALIISRWGLASICVTANVNKMGFFYSSENDFAYTAAHQLGLWGTMLLFIIVFTLLCIGFLGLVDRDKR